MMNDPFHRMLYPRGERQYKFLCWNFWRCKGGKKYPNDDNFKIVANHPKKAAMELFRQHPEFKVVGCHSISGRKRKITHWDKEGKKYFWEF